MFLLADIAVIVAVLITIPLAALIHGLRHPRDPQAGMAAIYFFFLSTPRWVLLMFALATALAYGAFDWMAAERASQVVLVVLVHLLGGGASLFAQFAASERHQRWWRNLFFLIAIALPAATAVAAMVGVNGSPGPARDAIVRAAGACVFGMTLIVGCTLLGVYVAGAPQRAAYARERAAEREQENQKYYRERLSQLNAIGPDEPLYKLIQFTYCNEPGDIATRARDTILARPNVLAELAESLSGKACYEGMWFLANHMAAPPGELAQPACDGILRISEHLREQLSTNTTNYPNQHYGEATRILTVVEKFAGTAVDFAAALRHLHDTFSIPQAGDAEHLSQSTIRQWLDSHPPGKSAK